MSYTFSHYKTYTICIHAYCITSFPKIHPIPELYVKNCKDNITNDDSFKELKTIDDFRQLHHKDNYLLDIHELITKVLELVFILKQFTIYIFLKMILKHIMALIKHLEKQSLYVTFLLYSSNNIITVNSYKIFIDMWY